MRSRSSLPRDWHEDAVRWSRTALHLWKDDPSELLRRLCIIMLEDAVLHPDLPIVAWLMAAAAKKFAPPLALVERCLAVVHQVGARPKPLTGPRSETVRELRQLGLSAWPCVGGGRAGLYVRPDE